MDPVPVGKGVAGVTFERLQPLLVSAGDPQLSGSQVAGRYASDSFAVAPIAAGGLNFGVLCATVVTLLIVPSGYLILEDLKNLRSTDTSPELSESS